MYSAHYAVPRIAVTLNSINSMYNEWIPLLNRHVKLTTVNTGYKASVSDVVSSSWMQIGIVYGKQILTLYLNGQKVK